MNHRNRKGRKGEFADRTATYNLDQEAPLEPNSDFKIYAINRMSLRDNLLSKYFAPLGAPC